MLGMEFEKLGSHNTAVKSLKAGQWILKVWTVDLESLDSGS
jgi:hypothetical protein